MRGMRVWGMGNPVAYAIYNVGVQAVQRKEVLGQYLTVISLSLLELVFFRARRGLEP